MSQRRPASTPSAPQSGPPSALPYATWGRRILALLIDWVVSTLVVVGLMGATRYAHQQGSTWVLVAYAAEATILTALAGGSFGQLCTGIRVLTTEGRPLNLLLALARTLLICLVVPPLIFRSEDGRGLHDLWTGSAAYVRRRIAPSSSAPGEHST